MMWNRFQSSFSVKIVPLSAFCTVLRSMTELRPARKRWWFTSDDFMNVCSTEFKKIRIKAWYPQYPLSYRRWTGACVALVYVISTMTLQSKKWKILCRKKLIDGPWRHLGYKGQIIPEMITRRLGQKSITEHYLLNSSTGVALRKAPLSNSFSSTTAFSVKKLTHSEFWIWTVPVPNQLPSLHRFSDMWEGLSFEQKL